MEGYQPVCRELLSRLCLRLRLILELAYAHGAAPEDPKIQAGGDLLA